MPEPASPEYRVGMVNIFVEDASAVGIWCVLGMYQPNVIRTSPSCPLHLCETMPPREAEDLLTEEQKTSLQAHVHEFRHGNRETRAAIVRKMAKTMHTDETLPLKQSKIRQARDSIRSSRSTKLITSYQAVKNWFFNRGKKPENIKQFRHRGYSGQDVFNRACREKITKAARAAMGVPNPEDGPISHAEDDGSPPPVNSAGSFVGVRQKMLSKMFSELPSSERKRYQEIAQEWTASRAPLDVMRK